MKTLSKSSFKYKKIKIIMLLKNTLKELLEYGDTNENQETWSEGLGSVAPVSVTDNLPVVATALNIDDLMLSSR